MMTDPIADLFTRIRNGQMVRHPRVDVPGSKMKSRILEILKEEGYIKNFRYSEDSKQGIRTIYYGEFSKQGLCRNGMGQTRQESNS